VKYETTFKKWITEVDKTIDRLLPAEDQYPAQIHEAMRYSVFPGGKRFRPVLTLAACEATGGAFEEALIPAASIELIHCYSLVHDDLPQLDNDEIRRGKLTCHKKYGEPMALLVGDALLTAALQILSKVKPAQRGLRLLEEISTSSGTYGMIGGQVVDLMAGNSRSNLPMMDYISIHKTGKLIKASSVSGAIAAGASKRDTHRMQRYGECIGLAFQAIDDLDDGDGYTRMTDPKEIRLRVRDLIAQAKREIKPLGSKANKLQILADFLLKRIPRGTHVTVDR